MTVKNEELNTDKGKGPEVDTTTGVTDEALENKGFNAAVDSLTPEPDKSPLETEVEDEVTDPASVVEDSVDPAAAEAVKAFIGEMSEEDVLDLLGKVDGLEDVIYNKLSRNFGGKFGEVGQQIQALKERNFTFDPEKLAKLRGVDEGIADALGADLAEAFSGQEFDSEALTAGIKQDVLGSLNPYMEQRLLEMMVPDVDTIVKTDEFGTWFNKEASQDVRDAFGQWDSRERMDSVALVKAFSQYKDWGKAEADKVAAKKETLARNVEGKTARKVPQARRAMTEEEAFKQRLNEGKAK